MHKTVVKMGLSLMLVAVLVATLPLEALACTGVYVGSNFTDNGSTYFGRSEDADQRARKVYGIEPATHNSGKTYSNAPESSTWGKFTWPYSADTYRFTYVRDSSAKWGGDTLAFAEAGTNEKGVSVSATVTTQPSSKIKTADPFPKEGITEYNLTSLLLGESGSAREGVELLGRILDERGCGGTSSFQVHIADATETWLFTALSGHQWVAQKMDANKLSVNPNMLSLLFDIELDDSNTCLHSGDIENMPVSASLAQYTADGKLDIGKTYGMSGVNGTYDVEPTINLTRYMQGAYYFNPSFAATLSVTTNAKGEATKITDPPLFFQPSSHDMDTQFILNSLASRGQGTPFASEVIGTTYALSNIQQMEAHFFEIREGLSPDIATIEWLSISRAEFGFYLPSYGALVTEVAECFEDGPIDHSKPQPPFAWMPPVPDHAMIEDPLVAGSFSYTMVDINDLCSRDRTNYGVNVRKYFDALQADIIAQHNTIDQVMQSLPADGSAAASGMTRSSLATESSIGLAKQMFEKSRAVLLELREHITTDKANGANTEFVPSDMNIDGSSKTPLSYAAYAYTPPVLASQPVSALYALGEAPLALTVGGNDSDGLSYEWFERTVDGREVSLGTSADFVPATDVVGVRSHFVRVKNAEGLSVDSELAIITVREAIVADATANSFSLSSATQGNDRLFVAGSPFTITAITAWDDSTTPVLGDERYIPLEAKANPTVSFPTSAPYVTTMTIPNPGDYALVVTFALQRWDGSAWTSTATTDTKSSSLSIAAFADSSSNNSKQGDNAAGTDKLSKVGDLVPLATSAVVAGLLLAMIILVGRKAFKKR